MENIHIQETESTPEMIISFTDNKFWISGESYPENVTKCYGEVFEALKTYLANLEDSEFTAEFKLIYFNSSSVKIIMNLFDIFDECASRGNNVNIIWYYQEDDETIQEFGEEFSEDLEHANFKIEEV